MKAFPGHFLGECIYDKTSDRQILRGKLPHEKQIKYAPEN